MGSVRDDGLPAIPFRAWLVLARRCIIAFHYARDRFALYRLIYTLNLASSFGRTTRAQWDKGAGRTTTRREVTETGNLVHRITTFGRCIDYSEWELLSLRLIDSV